MTGDCHLPRFFEKIRFCNEKMIAPGLLENTLGEESDGGASYVAFIIIFPFWVWNNFLGFPAISRAERSRKREIVFTQAL
jgi:hypothetical protein